MKTMLITVTVGLVLMTVCAALPGAQVGSELTRGGNNLIMCNNALVATSSLAYSYVFTREALFLQTRTETLIWPQNDLGVNPITCMRVLDQITNNQGGYVDMTRGGLGATYVELVFTSRWSKRMSFKIEIYTKNPEPSATTESPFG